MERKATDEDERNGTDENERNGTDEDGSPDTVEPVQLPDHSTCISELTPADEELVHMLADLAASSNRDVDFNSEYFSKVLERDACNTMISKCKNSQTCHQAVKALTQEIIENTTECYDLDTLHAVKKHLNSALLVLKLGINKELPAFNPTSNPAPNKNHEKQPRFFSTKRKRPSKARMPKPSYEDQETALNKLEQTEVIVCNYCWKEEDDHPVVNGLSNE